MSRGKQFPQFNAAARDWLEADVGVVDNPSTSCGVGACDEPAVYRVPWHSVGGDIAYCSYHLARYRELHPELFERVQAAVNEDLTALATRGDRSSRSTPFPSSCSTKSSSRSRCSRPATHFTKRPIRTNSSSTEPSIGASKNEVVLRPRASALASSSGTWNSASASTRGARKRWLPSTGVTRRDVESCVVSRADSVVEDRAASLRGLLAALQARRD